MTSCYGWISTAAIARLFSGLKETVTVENTSIGIKKLRIIPAFAFVAGGVRIPGYINQYPENNHRSLPLPFFASIAPPEVMATIFTSGLNAIKIAGGRQLQSQSSAGNGTTLANRWSRHCFNSQIYICTRACLNGFFFALRSALSICLQISKLATRTSTCQHVEALA